MSVNCKRCGGNLWYVEPKQAPFWELGCVDCGSHMYVDCASTGEAGEIYKYLEEREKRKYLKLPK